MTKIYQVTELNVTRIWIEWAGRLAFGCEAKLSLSGLRFMPSPGKLLGLFKSQAKFCRLTYANCTFADIETK